MKYCLIDSGNQLKLEQFGPYRLVRPCAQAFWKPSLEKALWDGADAFFTRENGNRWTASKEMPTSWQIELEGILLKIAPTDFGHLGVFPEHQLLWGWMKDKMAKVSFTPSLLNLFAYSGAATLALAKAGAQVCHVDASKGMVAWARENAKINGLSSAPIRWIVDDVVKFLQREIRRGVTYDGILLDPPSFGRGASGEVFKMENDFLLLLETCRKLLSQGALFFLVSSHTAGMSPMVMHHVMEQQMKGFAGTIESGEMIIPSTRSVALPCGSFARWSSCNKK